MLSVSSSVILNNKTILRSVNLCKKLVWRDYLYVGSMLFGLFFGAGNLIFLYIWDKKRGFRLLANLGFLATGIGLPFLGVIAMGVSKSSGVLT